MRIDILQLVRGSDPTATEGREVPALRAVKRHNRNHFLLMRSGGQGNRLSREVNIAGVL